MVIGSNGRDTLIGGPKGDILVAGRGQQTLTGNGGADIFDFSKPNTNAKVTDYQDGLDKLQFEHLHGLNFRDVHISSDHGNAVVDIGTEHIVLVGVNPHQLDSHDFVFNT